MYEETPFYPLRASQETTGARQFELVKRYGTLAVPGFWMNWTSPYPAMFGRAVTLMTHGREHRSEPSRSLRDQVYCG